MTHDLVATFTNSLGKEHDWTYKGLDASVPIPEIKEACELLTSLDIFEKDGVKLFDSVVTAKVVTTTDTTLFDDEAEPAEKQSTEKFTDKSTTEGETVGIPATYPKATVDSVDKPEENYSHSLFSVDKSALLLAKPADKRDTSSSLKLNTQINGKEALAQITNESAAMPVEQGQKPDPSLQLQEPEEQPKLRIRLLDRLRRRRNRNKEDPLVRPPDDDTRS